MAASAPPDAAGSSEREGAHVADVLRVIACGSVDDGKSTLIGRLLCDVGAIPIDEINAAQRDRVRIVRSDLQGLVDVDRCTREIANPLVGMGAPLSSTAPDQGTNARSSK